MLVGWQPTAKQRQMPAAARDIYAVGQAVVAVAFWSILQAIIKWKHIYTCVWNISRVSLTREMCAVNNVLRTISLHCL